MARVTGPLHSDSASGAVGQAIVYGSWKGQYWVRDWVKPANPGTENQRNSRSVISRCTREWQGLSVPQRASWDAAALEFPNIDPITGLASPWSGFNLFTAAHFHHLFIVPDFEILTDPPVLGRASVDWATDLLVLVLNDQPLSCTWRCLAPPPDFSIGLIFYLQRHLGPGEKASWKKSNLIGAAACNAETFELPVFQNGERFAVWARAYGFAVPPYYHHNLPGMPYFIAYGIGLPTPPEAP